jgi:hypothetical protein
MAGNMSYKLLRKYVETELKTIIAGKEQEFSYLVEGPHGIGKSAFWKELCIDFNGYFVDIRLGQRDLGDIIGLPVVIDQGNGTNDLLENKHMHHIKPELIRKMFVKDLNELGKIGDSDDKLIKFRLKENIGKPYAFILGFLDEYNRGTKDVQQAVFELVYDRTMNGDKINPKTLLAAACNDNLEVYTITEGDPAFRSRFKTIKYTPTVDEWLQWGKKTSELCPELIFVISAKKDLADPPKGSDIDYLNRPHPNRRSWHEFSKFYTQHRSAFTELEMRDICSTFVGYDQAETFRLLIQKMTQTQKEAATTQVIEVEKSKNYFNNFIRLQKITFDEAKSQMQTFSPSDHQTLAAICIDNFSKWSYVSGATKNRIIELSSILPGEIWTIIWDSIDDKNNFRPEFNNHLRKVGLPEKILTELDPRLSTASFGDPTSPVSSISSIISSTMSLKTPTIK